MLVAGQLKTLKDLAVLLLLYQNGIQPMVPMLFTMKMV